jgi:hypothetical protein
MLKLQFKVTMMLSQADLKAFSGFDWKKQLKSIIQNAICAKYNDMEQ